MFICLFNKSYNSTIRHFPLFLMSCPSFLILIYATKITYAQSGMVVHALILAFVRSRQTDLYEFEPILVHIVRSRTAKAAYFTLPQKDK